MKGKTLTAKVQDQINAIKVRDLADINVLNL